MCNTAAQLVDRVVPAVAVRQWVLSLPFELRGLAAFDAKVLSALSRFFADALAVRYRACARREGIDASQGGAVTFVQRFGSSLNLHVHFHVTVLDGVFARDANGVLVFHEAPAPTRAELESVAGRVHRRAVAWLARHGHVDDDGTPHRERGPLEACVAAALARGTVSKLADEGVDASAGETAAPEPPRAARGSRDAVDVEGFNLEASVRFDADDDLGRERLFRYAARPPFALSRMRLLPGGRIAYRIKKLRDGRAKQRVMTPVELLARLAALIPPPRYPLVRYHGVVAPRATWRREIVPKPRAPLPCKPRRRGAASVVEDNAIEAAPRQSHASPPGAARRAPVATTGPTPHVAPPQLDPRPAPLSLDSRAHAAPSIVTGSAPVADAPAKLHTDFLAPNVMSVRHWSRLLDGALVAISSRLDWATLLMRTFEVDVLDCPSCRGRLRILGSITQPDAVREILKRLAIPTEAPRAARARDPTDLDDDAVD